MVLLEADLSTLALVAALMVVCGAGIGRLLWLIEGRPHLDRPTWWPRSATADRTAPPVSAAGGTPTLAAGALACAACCGVPILLVAGVLGVGAVATFSLGGAVLLAVALVTWAVATGRAARWWRTLVRPDRTC